MHLAIAAAVAIGMPFGLVALILLLAQRADTLAERERGRRTVRPWAHPMILAQRQPPRVTHRPNRDNVRKLAR